MSNEKQTAASASSGRRELVLAAHAPHRNEMQSRAEFKFRIPLDEKGMPRILGEGRHAIVVEGERDFSDPPGNGTGCAVKFLRWTDSHEYNAQLLERFIYEIAACYAEARNGSGSKGRPTIQYLGCGLAKTASQEKWFRASIEKLQEYIGVENLNCLDEKSFSVAAGTGYFATNSERIAGIFYVMERAAGSLEEFLFGKLGWPNRSEIDHYHVSLSTKLLDKAEERSAIPWIEIAPKLRGTPAGYWEDYATVMNLFIKMMSLVSAFHKVHEKECAHRDLKLGNFLVLDQDTVELKLADLGFMKASGDKQPGAGPTETMDHRVLLMNFPGSQGYRAPEQFSAGTSLLISPIRAANEKGNFVIARLRDFQYSVRKGDVLAFAEKKIIEHGEMILVKNSMLVDEGYRLELDGKINFGERPEIHATVLRPCGQAADVFALGCALYVLATGGKDAERMYRRVFDWAAEHESIGGKEKVESSRLSCVEIAALIGGADMKSRKLEIEALQQFDADVARFLGTRSTEASGKSLFDKILDLVGATPSASTAPKSADHEYFLGVGQSQLMRKLFIDRWGNPIPLSVLVIIVRCLVRGRSDSVCTNANWSDSSEPDGAMKNLDNFSNKVLDLSRKLTGDPPLNGRGLELLNSLRRTPITPPGVAAAKKTASEEFEIGSSVLSLATPPPLGV